MQQIQRTVVITTGGTGGHMFPAASFASAILAKGHKIALITDKRGSGFKGIFAKHPIYKVRASSPRGGIFKLFFGMFNLGIGFLQAFWYLGRVKPDIVVAFGGYASAPTVVAALFRFIPVVIHEQNAVMGKANRFSSRFAKLLALSFPETKRVPKRLRTTYVGMPVREKIKFSAKTPYPEVTDDNEFRIFIFGGSQGSKIFSLVIPYAMSVLEEKYQKRIKIVQQCRVEEIEEVRKVYNKAGIKYQLAPFFEDMDEKIKDCHLLICRAGASTIAEATVIGRPMIMIPLKISCDGDQAANAKNAQDAGAGWIINEPDFNPSELKKTLEYLMDNKLFLQEAAYNSSRLGIVDADVRLAEVVLKECK